MTAAEEHSLLMESDVIEALYLIIRASDRCHRPGVAPQVVQTFTMCNYGALKCLQSLGVDIYYNVESDCVMLRYIDRDLVPKGGDAR